MKSIIEVIKDKKFDEIKLKPHHKFNGGIAYRGETLDNFMYECNINPEDDINVLQTALIENGIMPIKL